MVLKKIVAVFMLLLDLLLTGCASSHEVNTLGISVCLGIDKTENGYRVSEQVINPRAIASKKSTNESPVVVYTGEGTSIHETIARLTTVTSRKIYHSHLRMVILGEEVAKQGIADIIDYLLRYHEFRTDFYFAIAKGATAKEILDILTPVEAIPGVDMFNKLKMSYENWAPTKAMRIIELANDLSVDGIDPTINSVMLDGDSSKTDSTDILKKSGDFVKLRFADVGVFKKDRLVGWLNENEAKGYNYIVNNVKHSSGSNSKDGIEFSTDVLQAKSKIKASVVDHQPKLQVQIKIKYVVTQYQGKADISKIENTGIFNEMVSEKAKNIADNAIKKAQEYGADIFGFGERIHDADPIYWKTVKEHWGDIFKSIPVSVTVNADMIATDELTKPITSKD
jgi:spore germination protein KC